MNCEKIRKGIANRIATIPQLVVVSYVPDQVEMDTACVIPGDPYIDYHGTMGPHRLGTMNLEVLVCVARDIDFQWQSTLDAYCSTGSDEPRSIIDVIEADLTVGVTGVACHVTQARGWDANGSVNNAPYAYVRFPVTTLQFRS